MRFIVFLACLSLALGFQPRSPNNVYGGQAAPEGSRPYQAYVAYGKGVNILSTCGGALIGSHWVLTAAKCVNGDSPTAVARFGSQTLDELMSVDGEVWAIHEGFDQDASLILNDIALIKLDSPATDLPNTQVISLPQADSSLAAAGTNMLLSGWGVKRNGVPPRKMQQVVLNLISKSACENEIGFHLQQSQFCASGNGKGACNYDFGTPLISNYNWSEFVGTDEVLEGIFSWGPVTDCANPLQPGIYTRVAKYCQWIADKTSQAGANLAITCPE